MGRSKSGTYESLYLVPREEYKEILANCDSRQKRLLEEKNSGAPEEHGEISPPEDHVTTGEEKAQGEEPRAAQSPGGESDSKEDQEKNEKKSGKKGEKRGEKAIKKRKNKKESVNSILSLTQLRATRK